MKIQLPFISKKKAALEQIEFFNKGFKNGCEEGREQVLLGMMQDVFSMVPVDKLITKAGVMSHDVGGIVLVSPGGSPVAVKRFQQSRIIESDDEINIKF